MEIGVVLPTYRRLAAPDNIVRAARLAEELGFESVWTTDHVVIPVEQEDLFGPVVYDPLATLAYVAGLTSKVKLGVAVLVVPYRHPLPLAKTLATLDQLSGGRLIVGAGLGWLPAEFEALGLDVRRRASLTDDALMAMRACWDHETPSHRGPHYAFEGVLFAPRPMQPRLPVWIGGVSEAALKRAARLGDGWISDGQTFEELTASLRTLDLRLAEEGRDRSGFTVALRTGLQVVGRANAMTGSKAVRGHMGGQQEPVGRTPFRGTDDEVAADLAQAAALGIDHLVFEFPIARGEESMDLFQPLAEIRGRAGV